MKLYEADFSQFLNNIPGHKKIFLLHGTIVSKIWFYRKSLEIRLVGRNAQKEMRLVTYTSSDLSKDAALLSNEMKTRSFFGGKKVVILDSFTDKETRFITDVLNEIDDADPYLIITAGFIKQTSKLRLALEQNPKACSVGFYQNEMSSTEIESYLGKWKLHKLDSKVLQALKSLSKQYDFLEFRQELRKLALFKAGDDQQLTLEELEDVFSKEANPDEKKLIDILIDQNINQVVEYFENQFSSIKNPITLIARIKDKFKILHKLKSNQGFETEVFKQIWPPFFGKNKERIIEASKKWKLERLEKAIMILGKIDLDFRQNSKLKPGPVLISVFLRICMLKN